MIMFGDLCAVESQLPYCDVYITHMECDGRGDRVSCFEFEWETAKTTDETISTCILIDLFFKIIKSSTSNIGN